MKILRPQICAAIIAGALALGVLASTAQEAASAAVGIARNPDDIASQVRSANEIRDSRLSLGAIDGLFQPWYDAKTKLSDDLGLNFGVAYTPLYQVATDSLTGDDQTGGHIFEVFGTWDIFARNTDHPGILGFRGEYRGRLGTDLSPQNHFTALGSGWPNAIGFSEFDLSLAELWWEQHFIEDRFAIRIGKMLPFAVYDYGAFKSPKTGFTNAAMTLNPTIGWPQFGLGAALHVRPVEDIYISGGIHDANGDPTKSGFESFFDDREYFISGEIGWDRGYLTEDGYNPLAPDYHVTFWHTDARSAAGRPEGWGFSVAGQQPVGDLVAFARYGYSDGGAAILKQMVTAGFAIPGILGKKQNTLGLGLSWGKPSAAGRRDQYVSELYYKGQFTRRLAVTPSVQLIANPSAYPGRDLIALFGLRARIDF